MIFNIAATLAFLWFQYFIRGGPESTRVPRESPFSAPAPSPLEFFTRLFLEYTVLLAPFF